LAGADVVDDLPGIGEALDLPLGEHRLAVDLDVEDALGAGDDLGVDAE